MQGYKNEPYSLYADNTLKQKGVTDDDGAITFDHIPSIKQYEVKLVNGHSFTFSLKDPEQEPLEKTDYLVMSGFRSFGQSTDTIDPLNNEIDYRSIAANPIANKTRES